VKSYINRTPKNWNDGWKISSPRTLESPMPNKRFPHCRLF
jgi:hypothetical protein